VGAQTGADAPRQDANTQAITWGTIFGDFNLDGWEDLYAAAGYIERDAVAPFQNRVGHKHVAQAQRIACERRIAADRTLKISLAIELNLPEGSTRGINDKHIPLMIEGNAVGD